MEGDASDKGIAYMLQQDEADGPYYHQEWEGMPETTPIISGGVNAFPGRSLGRWRGCSVRPGPTRTRRIPVVPRPCICRLGMDTSGGSSAL
jgi:hypothetical protein